MTTRLSQKAVADDFYEDCINLGVPCLTKHDGKRGFFMLQSSYGGLQLQYRMVSSGVFGISSGFVGAREMYTWLRNFDPVSQYKYYRKREMAIIKSNKERRAREKNLKRT
jgi:hypothetical protein